jgi:TP901 family phage tail tape measure protein
MAVKTITANLNVVPVGIENTKAKLQELMASANISPKIKADIQDVINKIGTVSEKIQGQLSSKGVLNIDRMGFGKIDEAIFKVAKNIAKELGVAFDTTKVDEYAKKIDDVNSQINANETALSVNEKGMAQAKGKIVKASKDLPPAMRGEDAEVKVKERILEIDNQLANNVKSGSVKAKKLAAEREKLSGFLTTNKNLIEKVVKLQKEEIDLNRQKVTLTGELNNLTTAQQQATSQAISEIPEIVKANEAVKQYTDAKSELIKATMDQAQANADTAQSELDVDNTQKKSKKSLLEKIFALFTFQKVMQFVNRTVRDAVKTIKDLDKAITDMALVTTLSREEAWKLVGAMQSLATQTGLATSQIAGVIVQFIRQGRSVADAFELAEVAAKSAKVAGIDANEAVNYLTAAVNGFGLAANGAEMIADKFAAIAAKSASSFEELALAMSKVAPTAKSAGVSVDFMMGVIAKGIETTREAPENIGTAFKTIFARMREVTDLGKAMEDGMDLNRVEKALLSVGVPLRDAAGQFRNLETVLTEVGRKWEDLTSVEQAYLATALAGSRQQPRLLAIFNDFARTEELISVSAGAAGELEDQHLDYMEGLEASLVNMKNAWEQVVTAFMSSEVVITIINFLSTGFANIARTLEMFGSPVQNTVVALVGLTVALGIYTLAKYKSIAAEQMSNAQGALTTMQLIKLNILRGTSAGAISFETAVQLARNNTMREAIALYFMEIAEKIKLAIYSFAYATALKTETMAQVMKNFSTKQAIIQAGKDLALGAKKLTLSTLQLIKDKAKIVIDKIALFLLGNMNKGLIIQNKLTLKQIIAQKAAAIWGKIMAVVNAILSSTFVTLAISIASALFWLLPFIAAGAALIAIGYFLVTAFIDMTKSVGQYGKEIGKANAQTRELANKEKNIKKLADRFKELDSQVEKSAEDLDEMKSIAAELGEVTVGKQTFNLMTEDAFGNAMVNEEEYNKYLEASAKEREKLIKQEEKTFNKAIRKFGKDAFDDDSIANSARRLGYRMVEGLVEGIEDAELQKQVDNSIKASLAQVDMSVFVNAKGEFDNVALRKFAEQQVAIFQNLFVDIETLSEVEGAAIKNGGDAVAARVTAINSSITAYKDALDEIRESDLTDEQKDELEMALNLTFSGEAGLLELIEERSLSVEVIAELSLRGMSNNEIAAFISRQIRPATERAQEEAFAGAGFESTDADAERERLQAERDEIVDSGGSRYRTGKARMAEIDAQLAELDSIEEEIEGRSEELEAQGVTLLSNIFTSGGGTLEQDMVAYKAYLKDTLKLSEDEANAMMASVYNALGVDSSEAIAASINATKSDRNALYGLQEDIAKGNFESLTMLAGKYGAEAVQAFISGDPAKVEGFFAKQKEETIDNIDDSIEALQALGRTRKLTDIEKGELLALQTMKTYYEDMSDADMERTYWLGKSKELISEMNDLLKISANLMTLGLSEEHPLVSMLNSLADAKFEEAVGAAQSQLDNEREALLEFGTMDEDGVFSFNENLTDAQAVQARAALDGYLETLGDYTNTLVAEYNRQADIVKKRYQDEINAMKEAHSERWKEIEYLDKVQELEGKIIDARRELMAFSLDNSMTGQMTDSLESLQKLQQERQKMIEQQMMEQAQKELEAERDNALVALGQQQITAMENLIMSIDNLGEIMRDPTPPPAGGGGGSASSNTLIGPGKAFEGSLGIF